MLSIHQHMWGRLWVCLYEGSADWTYAAAAVGGGFNGKSTLLQAIEAGVYDKVRPGFHAR